MYVPPDQIQEREKKDPHDVHEVPVEAGHLDRRVPLRGVSPLAGLDDENGQDAEADDHVQGVEARHREVERKEELRRAAVWARVKKEAARKEVVADVLGVFDGLDAQERRPEK